MSRNQTPFYATKADLRSLLLAVEAQRPLQFVIAGLQDSPQVQSMHSLWGTEDLGIFEGGDVNHARMFLIADSEISINVREVPQHRGGFMYAIDQLANPKTVTLVPGRRCEPSFLLTSQIDTCSTDPSSLALYRLFRNEIRRQFVKIKSAYVGPEAEALLDAGWRLTTSSKAPVIYDLTRD